MIKQFQHKSLRKIPKRIEELLPSLNDSLRVGVVRRLDMAAIEKDGVPSLGIPAAPIEVDDRFTIIPDPANGRQSSRNVNGDVRIRRDLPKVSKLIDMGERPIYGDWGNGSFDLVVTRKVYQKEEIPPANLTLRTRVLAVEDVSEQVAVLHIFVDAELNQGDAEFLDDLLSHLRLLKESCGECDVFPADSTDDDLLKRVYVGWELLPPGERDATIARIISAARAKTADAKERIRERYDFWSTLEGGPQKWILGHKSFAGYFGAIFGDYAFLDNLNYGNAAYRFKSDEWEEMSKLSRTELINKVKVGFERIPHRDNWQSKIRKLVTSN